MISTSCYLDFLKFCLHPDVPIPKSVKTMDWNGLYDFAIQQGVVGIMQIGLNKLGKVEENPMPIHVLATWIGHWQSLEAVHKERLAYIHEIVEQFKSDGYRVCLLKGEGVSRMYPSPWLRNVGDVDLWFDGNRQDIIRYVKDISPNSEIKYMHSKVSGPGGVLIEIHYTPTCKNDFYSDHILQQYINSHKEEQMQNLALLPDGGGYVCVPTDSFNRILLMSHMMAHFISEGAGLNLLVDYFYLLQRGFTKAEQSADIVTLKRTGMLKFAQGVMWIEQNILGLQREFLLTKPDESVGKILLNEILAGGSYGKYDSRYNFSKHHSALSLLRQEMRRNIRFVALFPNEVISRPLFKLWHRSWQLYYNHYKR